MRITTWRCLRVSAFIPKHARSTMKRFSLSRRRMSMKSSITPPRADADGAMSVFAARLAQRLQEREAEHLYRQRRILASPQAPDVRCDGRELLAFCSNDYLGLANHPEVIAAFKQGLDLYGAGSGASHLVAGHSEAHHALEEELAA